MNPVFPPEIIKTSVENHFSQFSNRSKLVYLMVLLFFIGAVVSLFFIKAEITVQSRGILRASSEPVPLISPVVAKVIKVALNENDFIKKGDTIMWLDCERVDERISHLKNLIHDNEFYLSDLDKMLEYKYSGLETNLFQSTHEQYRQKLAEYDLNIALRKKLCSRAKTLFNKKVIPFVEMEETQFELDKMIEERKNYVRASRNEWENWMVTYRLENKEYKNEILNLQNEKRNYMIIAPISGHIVNFSGIQSGGFVTTGESLASISPDEKIIAENLVPPKDIGYLKNGMPVVFQIDAYNYNQWGLASGEITEISDEVYLVNNQPFFRVRSSLNQSYLTLKNGYEGKLKKGLTTTARFRITKRTLAQMLFDKTDDWLNPKIISE